METEGEPNKEHRSSGIFKSKLMLAFAAGIFLSVTVAHEEGLGNVSANPTAQEVKQEAAPVTNTVRRIHTLVSGPASNYKLHGVDVSRHQRLIDWQSIQDAGFTFAFIKATEGVMLRDSFFEQNWSGARQKKITRGAYHFFIAEKNAGVQAANFIINVKLEPGDLPPVLDVETTRGRTGEEIRAGMRQWLAIVEKAYGVKPIIYSNPLFYNTYLAGHFDGYKFWIASYGKKKKIEAPQIDWHFWQYTDEGKLDGIAKEVDLNVFHGDSSEFFKLTMPDVPKKASGILRMPS
jgi:lysozyme